MWITPADSQVHSLASLTMTLDNLFHDLESQLERELDAQLQNRLDDEERERQCALSIRDRIFALTHAAGCDPVTVVMKGGVTLVLLPERVGKDWFVAQILEPHDFVGLAIIAVSGIESMVLTPEQNKASLGESVDVLSAADLHSISARPRLIAQVSYAFVLRDVGRRRKQLDVVTSAGKYRGTIDRVGADHIEVGGQSAVVLPLKDVLYVRVL
ncbi:hypothetical protein M2119_000046 [Aurantimicrobium minutum]|nr:hypothetical protein [Aurantimicrobium minutum]